MYVLSRIMSEASYMQKNSKKLWYLLNTSSCCFFKSHGSEPEQENAFDKSQDTRNKILIAAFNEIYMRGFQAASINTILKDTGITKGALYHHFANKQELGYSVLDEVIRNEIHVNWIKPLKNTNDPLTVLSNIIVESGKIMTQDDVR